jgi:hypothetical protein
MANYLGARPDFIPSMAASADEQDVTDQHLPTYDEARADQEPQGTSQRSAPLDRESIIAALVNEAQRDPKGFRRAMRRATCKGVCVILCPGVGLTIFTIVAYYSLAQAQWLTHLGL